MTSWDGKNILRLNTTSVKLAVRQKFSTSRKSRIIIDIIIMRFTEITLRKHYTSTCHYTRLREAYTESHIYSLGNIVIITIIGW